MASTFRSEWWLEPSPTPNPDLERFTANRTGDYECRASVRAEPRLCRSIESGQIRPYRIGPTVADDGDVENRDSVLASYGHPEFFAVACEGGLVRLAADQDATAEQIRVGVSLRL